MNIPESCDVVVIGGGPGGSTASTLLAQKGYDVVLLERAKHPRYTVGESLIPHFWKYAELIGVDKKIDEENFVQKAGGTVVWDGVIRQMQFKSFGYGKPALHVERDSFDHILLEHAKEQGVKVFEEVTVTKVDPEDHNSKATYRVNGEKESREIACKFIIDCSGQKALIARQFGMRNIDDGFKFMSIWGYYDDSKYIAADAKAYPFEMLRKIPPTTFVTNIDEWGWVWHIPQRESTSVGLILPQDMMKEIKSSDELLEEYFKRRCMEIPHLDKLLENATYKEGHFHVIRNYSYSPEKLTDSGYFICGDAAAFIDPIFSIGVVLAMYSANVATWAIDRSMKNPASTERNRAIFAKQYKARYEASRALALPRYGYGGENGELVKTSINFETLLEQELMHVVSSMTTRSENFSEMSRNVEKPVMESDKYHVVEEIVF